MVPEKGLWKSIGGGVLVLLILVVPVLVGYDLYLQWQTPTMDFYLDSPGSATVYNVRPGGNADEAGLEAGDVILTVDDVPFELWYNPQAGKIHILEVERRGERISLAVQSVRVLQVNYFFLASAITVALVFWGVGTLLFLRRFWHPEIRLLYLLAQTIAITILFPLSYQEPWSPPYWILSFSVIGFTLVAPLFFQYTITFPVKLGRDPFRFWGLLLLYSLVPVLYGIWLFNNQLGMQSSAIYFSLVVTAAVVFGFYTYQYRVTFEDRRRIRVIVFGTLVAVIPPVLLYLLPRAFHFFYVIPEWIAGLFLIIAPLSYLYATLRYNLFGIDRLINRTLVYALLSLGIFIVYLGPYLFLYQYVPDDLSVQLAFIFVLTLWIGWTFDWLRIRTQRLVDQLFYGGWYDYPAVVEKISNALVRSSTREQIIEVLTNQIADLMKLRDVYLWIGDPTATFPAAPPTQVRFRFKFQSDIPAQWTVGLHRDGDDLSDTDQRILNTLAQQAEIALNNAFLIETLRKQLDEIRASREALARTQHQLLRSREQERARLARDLHDGPVQSSVGLNIQLGLLLNAKDLGMAAKRSLKEMRSEIRRLSSGLRQVCADLRPPMLDTLGLGAALRSLIEVWSDQNNVKMRLNLSPDSTFRSLPDDVAVNFYRVAQEALMNIGKHANARSVKIALLWDADQLSMTIEDDGMGFDTPDTLHGLIAQSHFGLAGMRERVELIGGEWALKSGSEGTAISVIWRAERELQ